MLPLSMMLIILVEMNREKKLYNRLKLTGRFNFAILLIIAVASGYFTIRHIDSNSRQTLRKDYALSVSNIPGNIIKSMIWLSPVSSVSGSMLPIRMILESHLDTINKVEYPVESNIFSKLNSNRTTNIRISVLKNSYIFYLVIFLTLVLTFLGYRYKIGKIALSILIPTIFIYLLLPEFKFRPMYLYLPAAGFSIITINGLKKILSIMIEKHLNLLDISRKKMDDRTIAVTLLISILILCANLRYASSEYRMYWMPVVKSVNYSVSNMIKSKEQNMPNNDNQETPSQFWDMWAERLYNR